jgi:Zn-dependent protease
MSDAKPVAFGAFLPLALFCFLWFAADNVAEALLRASGGVPFVLFRVLTLVLGSLFGAGVLGSIGDGLASGQGPTAGGFLRAVRRYGARVLGAYAAITVLALFVGVVLFAAAGLRPDAPWRELALAGAYVFPLALLRLLWTSEIVAENAGLVRGLLRGVGTGARSPRVLLLAAALAAASTADRRPALPLALAAAVAQAAAMAFVLVALAPRLIAAIRLARGIEGDSWAALAPSDLGATGPRDRLARTAAWLAVLSFVPFVHLAALAAGLRSLRRPGLFSVRGLVAAGLGAFLTVVYVLAIAGHFLPRAESPEPGFGFLAAADPSLAEAVALIEASAWHQAIDRAEAAGSRSWAASSLVGVARTEMGDHDAAGTAFALALQTAGRSAPAELHYYHGRLQMARGSFAWADDSFTKALAVDPSLRDAERLRSLARNALDLPRTWKIVGYGLIVLFLLTTHEVGHAWTAWKLGDDTAKSQGRISLNPIRHLDPVGSVLLPAVLLWRGSEVLAGWARPVPVTREKLRNPARDQMVVSFAGPGVNLVVCLGAFLLLVVAGLGIRAAWPGAATFQLARPFGPMAVAGLPSPRAVGGALFFVRELLFTSLALGCFNLLPVPPLDGSWILSGLLPGRGQALFEQLRRWSFVLFLVLVLTPVFSILVAIPASLVWGLLSVTLASMGFA